MACFQIVVPRIIVPLILAMVASSARGATNPFPLSIEAEGAGIRLRWPSEPNERFQIECRNGFLPEAWQALATNLPATVGTETTFLHSNALSLASGFYRIQRLPSAPSFTFNWTGTNFTYTDAQRSFTGIMLKPAGNGPFPAVIISHGAGGTATGYSLSKAREMVAWGMVCLGPTLTHAAGGETNAPNMGNCPENLARTVACANVLASLSYVDTNRLALFGHSMGAFATIGDAAVLAGRIRAAGITAGGVIPDSAGTNNAAPTVAEANPVRVPFILFHCDADPVVPALRSELFQQLLITNAVLNQRFLYSSNSIPNTNNWHNIHQDVSVNANVLTNTFLWFQARGVLP